MKSFMFKNVCLVTLVCFSTSVLHADAYGLNRLNRVVEGLNKISIAHQKSSAELLATLAKLGLPKNESRSIAGVLVQSDKLPIVAVDGDQMSISLNSKKVLVSFRDADKDKIIIDGKSFPIDPKKNFEENLRSLSNEMSAGKTAFNWSQLLLPCAQADDSSSSGGLFGLGTMGTVLLIAGIALVGYLLYSNSQNSSKIKSLQASVDAQSATTTDIQVRQMNDHKALGDHINSTSK